MLFLTQGYTFIVKWRIDFRYLINLKYMTHKVVPMFDAFQHGFFKLTVGEISVHVYSGLLC